MHDMNQLMRKIQKETRTAGIAVSKLSQKNNPAPNTFFDDHIPNLETEMDKIERKTNELVLALRPEIANAVALRDRNISMMENAKRINDTGGIIGNSRGGGGMMMNGNTRY
tara:strand:+ start:426 stop:758 length:333 start_codon:yes stop_codon:yes gene_type:complete